MDSAADELQRAAARLRALAGGGHEAQRALAGGAGSRGDLCGQPVGRITRGRLDWLFPVSEAWSIDAGDGVAALPAATTQIDSEDDLVALIGLFETRGGSDRHRRRLPLAAFEFRLRRKTAYAGRRGALPADLAESPGSILRGATRTHDGTGSQANGR